MSVYSSSLYVDRPPEDVLCSLCLDVMKNPKQCINGHLFCEECINLALEKAKTCPVCKCDVTKENLGSNLFVRNVINKLEVKCEFISKEYEMDPCTWTGSLHARENHIANCEYQSVKCTNFGCDVIVQKRKLLSHLEICSMKDFVKQGKMFYTYPNGSTYDGNWIDDKRHGEGIYIHMDNGEQIYTYKGNFENDVFHGQGTWTDHKTNNSLIGEFKNGLRYKGKYTNNVDLHTFTGYFDENELYTGEGRLDIFDGRIITGIFTKGHFQDFGKIEFPPGLVVTGYFKDSILQRDNVTFYEKNGDIFKGSMIWRLLESGQKYPDKVHGTLTYADGSHYTGGFFEGNWHGKGEYNAPIGTDGYDVESNYKGDYVEGYMHGKGIYVMKDPNRKLISTYTGNFVKDHRSGLGYQTLVTYNKQEAYYRGNYLNNKEHGQGKRKQFDGSIYEGTFVEGKQCGQGTMTYPDGSTYIGNWLNDVYHGQGKLIQPNGDYYDGNWIQGKPKGIAIQFVNGSKYEGNFKDKMHFVEGLGKCTLSDGMVYEGKFRSLVPHGYGKIYKENGEILYDGNMENGAFGGYGRLHTTGGRYIEANFDKGGATGNVKIIYPDDMVLECIYKNHKIIEGSKGKITWKDGRQFEGTITQAHPLRMTGVYKEIDGSVKNGKVSLG